MLLNRFREFMQSQFGLQPAGVSLLLAVSGGLDSVVLTDLVAKSGYDFRIAHCNFQLREEESLRDEWFVRNLGVKYQKQVLVRRFDTGQLAKEARQSVQETARNLRYAWFREIMAAPPEELSPGEYSSHHGLVQYLATAHQANDNIETLLINFFRGTGISGLHGIPPVQGKVIRPLLFAKRREIAEYAAAEGLAWVEDSSNATDKYTRNFIRHRVIPPLQEIIPNLENNLLHNIERFREVEILYRQSVEQYRKTLLLKKGNEFHIPILKLREAVPLNTIIVELFAIFNFSAAQVEEIRKLMHASNGSYLASSTHRLIRNRNWLIVAPAETLLARHIMVAETDTKIFFEAGFLELQTVSAEGFMLTQGKEIAGLDAATIRYPLLLRKWKQGDYFIPLGMKGKKKLSRFFIDLKLSKTEKEKVWVLEMDKKIVWVVGFRPDDRFKITDSTKKVLSIRFQPAN